MPGRQWRGRDADAAAAPEFFVYAPGVPVPSWVTRLRVAPSARILPAGTFEYFKQLEEVELSEGLLEIGESALFGCTSLVRVILPSTLFKIGNRAFMGCASLGRLDLPEGLTEIGEWAFSGCFSLERVSIPSGVTTIGRRTFQCCSSLREVMLVNGIQEIGDRAFSGCRSLASFILPASIIDVSNDAFRRCTALRTVTWCGGFTRIGVQAFVECDLFDHFWAPSKRLLVVTEGEESHNFHLVTNGVVVRTALTQRTRVISSECFSTMSSEDMPELDRAIDEILRLGLTPSDEHRRLCDLLAPHEKRHKEEVTTLLELALWTWKARMAGSDGADPEGREEGRIKCGADQVIPNVLPFL